MHETRMLDFAEKITVSSLMFHSFPAQRGKLMLRQISRMSSI